MIDRTNGGSPVTHPQAFHTLPITVIAEAAQRDRYPRQSELKELSAFFDTGLKRLEIAAVLTQNAGRIVAAGANRIFSGGAAMSYLDLPTDPVGLPGSGYYVGEDFLSADARHQRGQPQASVRLLVDPTSGLVDWVKSLLAQGRPSLPSRFRTIDVSRYGPVRMRRSMRDLAWFLRYITYAVVAGDTSILSVNTRGLRGVIPEDVTLATVVALREMQWQATQCLTRDAGAAALVKGYFEVLITDYLAEKPADRLRIGASNLHPGQPLPQSYYHSALPQPQLVMKPGRSETETQEAIRAAYRQVFERDITQAYGLALADLESLLRSGQLTMKEFIRHLGKSRLYRREFYEPFTISRVIELASRHFLGRGLSCLEEFQTYFEVISQGGLPALVDALVDSQEYADYFGEETVPYLRGLGLEAQECRSWGPQIDLFKYSAPARKVPQFVTTFAQAQRPLPNQHPYGVGNDPLEIQFGAIFPHETRQPSAQPAHFSPTSRRILIGSGLHNGHHGSVAGANGATDWGRIPGTFGQAILKLEPSHQPQPGHHPQGPNLNVNHHSIEAVILGAYRQVFGREVLDSQRQRVAETKLKGGELTLREFIRLLAQSRPCRQLYWESLYITKSIEIIHRRLLGRPTYGREELNRYYDLAGKQGFYALVDALIDSAEYAQVFGDDTVPYERYLTPRGYALRSPHGPTAWWKPRETPAIAGEWMATQGLAAVESLKRPPSHTLVAESAAPAPAMAGAQQTIVNGYPGQSSSASPEDDLAAPAVVTVAPPSEAN
ncbi:MAG: phycobilisome rod-core linker polypeptide [Nodosilinea sp.]